MNAFPAASVAPRLGAPVATPRAQGVSAPQVAPPQVAPPQVARPLVAPPLAASPRAAAEALERAPVLPWGDEERLVGYGVAGIPLASGHNLALHRVAASSAGPAHTTVWLRTPDQRWRAFADAGRARGARGAPRLAVDDASELIATPVQLRWTGDAALTVSVPDVALEWEMQLTESPLTRLLAGVRGEGREPLRYSDGALHLLQWGAALLLRTGHLDLLGSTPTGRAFRLHPQAIWQVHAVRAVLDGVWLGAPRPLDAPARLAGLHLPRRGLFTVAAVTVR